MTSISLKLAVVAAYAGTALMVSVMNANSALAVQLNFTFTQEGFIDSIIGDDGSFTFSPTSAILTGSFSGEDLDDDKRLERAELTSFSLSFIGENSIIPDFTQDLDDLGSQFILLDLNSPVGENLKFSTGETVVDGQTVTVGRGNAENRDPATQTGISLVGGRGSTRSEQPLTLVQVNPSTPVPEPNSVIGLAGLTLLSLGRLTKKKLLSQRTGV
jgi:hypothetical protein